MPLLAGTLKSLLLSTAEGGRSSDGFSSSSTASSGIFTMLGRCYENCSEAFISESSFCTEAFGVIFTVSCDPVFVEPSSHFDADSFDLLSSSICFAREATSAFSTKSGPPGVACSYCCASSSCLMVSIVRW
jgi:hypothetical protein